MQNVSGFLNVKNLYTKNLFNVNLKSEGDLITMNRTCGECSACCKTHGVRTIQKKPGVICVHAQRKEGGCGIYRKRPLECKQFECAWLKGLEDDSWRPDKINIVITCDIHPEIGTGVSLWEVKPGILSTPFGRSCTLKYLRVGLPTFNILLNENPKLYLPEHIHSTVQYWEMGESRRPIQIVSFGQAVFELDR